MTISTKTGDDGTTGLMFNRRVSKTDARIKANGACDELNTALGMARAWNEHPRIAGHLFAIQKEMVILMGEIGCAVEDRARYEKQGFQFVTDAMVDALGAVIDDLEKNEKISAKHWATPGEMRASAMLDFARATCRRAEREVWAMREAGGSVSGAITRYLNRLSDLCWLYARWVETLAGVA